MKPSKIILLGLILLSTTPIVNALEDREHGIFTYETEWMGGYGSEWIPTNDLNIRPTFVARTGGASKPDGWSQSAEGFYQK